MGCGGDSVPSLRWPGRHCSWRDRSATMTCWRRQWLGFVSACWAARLLRHSARRLNAGKAMVATTFAVPVKTLFCTLMPQWLGMLVAAALLVTAYAAGNAHCAPDRRGRGCGTLRWAAVQIRRKVPSMCAAIGVAQRAAVSAGRGVQVACKSGTMFRFTAGKWWESVLAVACTDAEL